MQREEAFFNNAFYLSLSAIPSMCPSNGFLSGEFCKQQYGPRRKTKGFAVDDIITIGLEKQPYRTPLPIKRTEVNVFYGLLIA